MNKRKKTRNTLVELNINDDYEMLKKMCCLSIGKSIDYVMDRNSTCIKISKAIMQGREVINACTNMLRAISIKFDRSCDKNAACLPMIGINEE